MPVLLEPRPAPPAEKLTAEAPRRAWVWIALLAIVTAAAGGLYLWKQRTQEAQRVATAAVTRTATVQRGRFEVRRRVTGTTTARSFASIIAPRLRGPESDREMAILSLVKSGMWVKKGDVVAEFDPQQMRDHLDDTIAGYRQQENDVKKQVAQNELDLENYRQTLLVAKAALDKAKLDLKAAEVRSSIDAEILKLRVEEAQATYKQIADNMQLKEASHRAALRYDEIGLYKEKLHVQRHQEDLDRLVVRAPMDGMVILGAMQRPTGDQATYEVGDRVRPGQPFMKIVDPKALQLEGEINQAESSSFRIGNTAKIGLDAYPKSRLQGRVYSIGALAVGGRRQQYFIRSIPIKIQIENPTAGVIPDLTGHADILLASDENALLVPSSAVEHEKEGDFVYLQTPQGFQRRPVTVAGTNGTESMIEAGVSEGDVIRAN